MALPPSLARNAMHVADPQSRTDATRRELLALLLASLACVIVLTLGLVDTRGTDIIGLTVRPLLFAAFAAGTAGLGVTLVWYVLRRARRAISRAETDAAALRRHLATAEAKIGRAHV